MAYSVIGFGSRTPSKVLDALASVDGEIQPYGSISFAHALSLPPYRRLIANSNKPCDALPVSQGAANPSFKGIYYCLPTINDWMKSGTSGSVGGSYCRSAVLQGVPVTVYDPLLDTLLTEPSDVMMAFSKLDMSVANQLSSTGKHATVIVVGGGGREHALAVALAKSPQVAKVICAPGNGGTAVEGGKISNASCGQSNDEIVELAKSAKADMVVVGPEQPLVDGIVDELKLKCPGVRAFGPTKAASILESSKAFSKDFFKECGIRTATYENFTSLESALDYVSKLPENKRVVVKASGLAAGKGVLIPETKEDTIKAVKEIMGDKTFGSAGDTCVIEEFMTGPEASCLAFCDGTTAKLMPAAQDHKRALDNDKGLNTGGMGAYAPAPVVTKDWQDEIEEMCIKTVQKMAERGTPYVGVLYAGIMLTPDGPSMLEYNCRFGDPETEVVLPLLETDLYETFVACCDGNLKDVDVRFKDGYSACTVICAALGYPEKYPKGLAISGLADAAGVEGVKVYHAGTKVVDGSTKTSGGRVLAVTGMSRGLKNAIKTAYSGVSKINFTNDAGEGMMHHRTDIANRAANAKLRIGVLGSTRGTALIPVIEAIKEGRLNAEIVAVVSNRSKAPILDKGRALGPTVVSKFVSCKGLDRSQYDSEVTSILVAAGAEVVLCVGFMRILSKEFCDFWSGAAINVHPSLLPLHAGMMDLAVHQDVLDSNEKESGCTVHYVEEEVDSGATLVQKRCPVEAGDTAETLKARVQKLEGEAFCEAIEKLTKKSISYADAGVDIVAGAELVEQIKADCKSTRRPGCDASLGGFGSLFDLGAAGYGGDDVVIVGATDGVGTKLIIAQGAGIHQHVGVDLVAMCVNDLVVTGAEPLFFLDYYATGRLDVAEAAAVVSGIAEGCRQAGCVLSGGETAEMPSMYSPGDYDLGGFAVGAVRRGDILPANVGAGNVLIGIKSSGIHSNGFSLVRKLLKKEGLEWGDVAPWGNGVETVAENLLTPTKIYVKAVMSIIKRRLMNGSAHITGGGLLENLNRSLTPGTDAVVTYHPPLTPTFKWMQQASGLDDGEMLKTFNNGVGFILIVDEGKVEECLKVLREEGGEEGFVMGKLVEGTGEVRVECELN
ncbi:hypothetical protein TrRE_jg8870 [Triparma retinervis]|uniref:Phosphoribosylformylglycinamidine cyclo-ligase n=1 Tax=Triparma retinervis TaxID=2557542 RepID=A0A9W7DU81_9STRA|nr:hypothetical protein TrRE_jg8870 [Triparma retinervis]